VPHLAATQDDRAVVDALYDSLTAWDDAGRPVPSAAVSWTSDPSLQTWRFVLRPGATFHDGRRVTAEDFARSWARAVAGGAAGHLLADVLGHGAVAAGTTTSLAGVRSPAAGVVEVALARPRADLPEVLGHPALGPLHPADDRPGEVLRQPIGNGPFALSEPWAPGDFIRAGAWEGWRNGERVAGGIAEVLFRIADVDINFLAFTQGRRDLTAVPPDALPLALERFPGQPGGGQGPGLITTGRPEAYLLAIDRRVPPFDDRAVREAVSLVVDRRALAAAVDGGNADPATSLLPPSLPGARPGTCDLCTSNPTGARARFEAAGVRSLPFAFNAGGGHEVVRDALRASLSDLDVALVSNGRRPAPDLPTYQARLAAGGVGLFRLPLVADVPSALAVLQPLLHSGQGVDRGGLNAMGYADPQVDALLDQAARTADVLDREALLRRVEDLALNRDVVVVPLVTPRQALVASDAVEGVRASPFGLVDLTRVRSRG
jgi:ABC-type transport system substrate-binding protein